MSDARRTKIRPVILSRQDTSHPAHEPVWLLSIKEIGELWGWKYNTAVGRVYAAANQGRIRAYQRRGYQKFYVSSEVEAVFGPPAVPKPAWAAWFEFGDDDAELTA